MKPKTNRCFLFLKRSADIFLSIIALVALFPILLIIAVAIKVESHGPVFFHQKRVGLNKKTFYIIKFRSMRTDAPRNSPTHLLENPNIYITKVGKFIRMFSLDELPQLFNILKGDMSVVGPRPALWNQEDLVTERDKYRANSIRPGLSGLAQIHGRDELEISDKAKLDGEYVKNMGVWLDLKIIFLTVFKVFRREGIREGKK